MNGTDFVRLTQPGIIVTLGGLFFVMIAAWFVTRQGLEERTKSYVRWGRNIIAILFVAAFAWQVFAMASVNVAPRSTLDRSDVDSSNRNFNNR